jgi:hypothetical protein
MLAAKHWLQFLIVRVHNLPLLCYMVNYIDGFGVITDFWDKLHWALCTDVSLRSFSFRPYFHMDLYEFLFNVCWICVNVPFFIPGIDQSYSLHFHSCLSPGVCELC